MTDTRVGLEKKPEEALRAEFIEEYRQNMDFFYYHLVELHTNIYIIDKILQFPFKLFTSHDERIFFRQVVVNFFDICLLTITKLIKDQGEDIYTLDKHKTNLLTKYLKPEYQDAYKERLREGKFDAYTKQLLDKAVNLRDKRIAHFLQDYREQFSQKIPDPEQLSFSELKKLCDELNRLFHICSLNAHYSMLDVSYDGKAADIDKLLDSIARNSRVLNMPEQDPQMWKQGKRPQLSEQELAQFNFYRKKFGLPES